MDCSEKECGGVVNINDGILVKTSCGPPTLPAYPCVKCGRLHGEDGLPLFNRGGDSVFFRDGGLVIKHVKTGQETRL